MSDQPAISFELNNATVTFDPSTSRFSVLQKPPQPTPEPTPQPAPEPIQVDTPADPTPIQPVESVPVIAESQQVPQQTTAQRRSTRSKVK